MLPGRHELPAGHAGDGAVSDPLSAVAEALPRTVEAVAAVAVAVRPDPAVAAVRAERMKRGRIVWEAHHRGRLVTAAGRLRREAERRPPGRARDAMEARLEGVREELRALGAMR